MTKESYKWPLIQAGASIMSVVAGITGLCLFAENRKNPFFHAAILNPALYAYANINQVRKIRARNKSYVESIKSELTEVKVER